MEVIAAEKFLIAKSFLVRNRPIEKEVRLTEKGMTHYKNGSSFDENYEKGYLTRWALRISILSAIISVIALAVKINL